MGSVARSLLRVIALAVPTIVLATFLVVPASAGRREFDKYASVLLIDPEGRERVLFEQEQLTPESLAHDIGKLQDG